MTSVILEVFLRGQYPVLGGVGEALVLRDIEELCVGFVEARLIIEDFCAVGS